MTQATRVLMVYPRSAPSRSGTTRNPAPWSGPNTRRAARLITGPAMLPPTWDIRLVNRNTEE